MAKTPAMLSRITVTNNPKYDLKHLLISLTLVIGCLDEFYYYVSTIFWNFFEPVSWDSIFGLKREWCWLEGVLKLCLVSLRTVSISLKGLIYLQFNYAHIFMHFLISDFYLPIRSISFLFPLFNKLYHFIWVWIILKWVYNEESNYKSNINK